MLECLSLQTLPAALGLPMPETPFPSPEELQKKIQEFMKANFGEHVAVSAFTQQSSTDEPPEERQESIDPFQFNATPKQIKAHLDRFVIQQDEAKKTLSIAVCDHYNHVNRIYRLEKEDPEAAKRIEYIKGNVLLLGPTGVGKTYLVKHIAELIGVPFVKADATKFSETGYVGGDVEDLVRGLVQKADGNVELAQYGIIYIDEIDKIAGRESGHGPDVSREGVQRDILPIVEGTTVNTRHGFVRTDHILFIAAGAFHVSKPSDMIPELQGRFPIRVELKSLTVEDFIRILKEPQNALSKQYVALMETEGIKLNLTDDALEEVARFAAKVNENAENIGARRLHTIMEKLLEEISFDAPDMKKKNVKVDGAYVRKQLADIVKDQDLSRYIL